MKVPRPPREEGRVYVRVFWLASIVISVILTLLLNGIFLLFHH